MLQFGSRTYGRETFDDFLRNLLNADWERTDGPLRLSPGLTLADLAQSDFFFNARLFLAALAESGGTATTATGNLTRDFVGKLFEQLRLAEPLRMSTRNLCKVKNEQDVWPLHIVRIVCECAGLVSRRKKRFQLTKAGRTLLPDDQAGRLFRVLFLAHFRRFDLHYDFFLRDVPGIQETMAVILWRLDMVAHDWIPMRGLAPAVLLPGVLAQLRKAMKSEYDKEEWILAGYVLDNLSALGLIECKNRSDWPRVTENDSIRVTSLWRKFIGFGWKESHEKTIWN